MAHTSSLTCHGALFVICLTGRTLWTSGLDILPELIGCAHHMHTLYQHSDISCPVAHHSTYWLHVQSLRVLHYQSELVHQHASDRHLGSVSRCFQVVEGLRFVQTV